MATKTRQQYEAEIGAVPLLPMHTQEMKTLAMLEIIANILLDIRQKLFNPDMK
jgi:hypothetical protein